MKRSENVRIFSRNGVEIKATDLQKDALAFVLEQFEDENKVGTEECWNRIADELELLALIIEDAKNDPDEAEGAAEEIKAIEWAINKFKLGYTIEVSGKNHVGAITSRFKTAVDVARGAYDQYKARTGGRRITPIRDFRNAAPRQDSRQQYNAMDYFRMLNMREEMEDLRGYAKELEGIVEQLTKTTRRSDTRVGSAQDRIKKTLGEGFKFDAAPEEANNVG